jgi:hypothetical protein
VCRRYSPNSRPSTATSPRAKSSALLSAQGGFGDRGSNQMLGLSSKQDHKAVIGCACLFRIRPVKEEPAWRRVGLLRPTQSSGALLSRRSLRHVEAVVSLGSSRPVRSAALVAGGRRRDRVTVADSFGRLPPPYERSPNPVVAEPFFLNR